MPIRTCIFDLGNVLVFFSHDLMVKNVADVSGAPEDVVRRFLFDEGYQKAIETGRLTEEQFHQTFQSETGHAVDFDALRHAVGNIFTLNPPMVPLLEDLRAAGIRLILLSNTCQTHIEFVRQHWSFLDLFDGITTSWEVGAVKPETPIYESALAQAQCPPADCFFTDDIEDYVQQAAAMGIQAHVFKDAATTRQTLQSLGVPLDSQTT